MLKPAQSHTNIETCPNVKQPFEMWLWLFTLPLIKTGQILPEMLSQVAPNTGPSQSPIPVSNDHNQEKCPGDRAGK